MRTIQQRTEKHQLSAETIDRLSEACSQALGEAGVDRRDIIRLRISLEEILAIWLLHLGEGKNCSFYSGVRFGKPFLEVRVEGPELNPENLEEAGNSEFIYEKLMAQAGIALTYIYKNGENRLSIHPPKKKRVSQGAHILLSIVLGAVLGGISLILPREIRDILTAFAEPLFQAFLGVLKAISSPLILLAVCCGILSLGDLSAVGKIGKKVLLHMLGVSFVVAAVSLLALGCFFSLQNGGGAEMAGGFQEIYQMFLDILPGDLVTPFLEANAMQIIFMGAVIGIALLVLGERVSLVKQAVEQLNETVKYIMELIGRLIPLFIFLSLYTMISSNTAGEMNGILKGLVLAAGACLAAVLIFTMISAAKLKVSWLRFLRVLLPCFLIGLTTASSAAVLPMNLDVCEKKLGIPAKITNFAVPLGQVLFMPSCTIEYLALALCMAEKYQISITPVWLVTALIAATLLSIASPPVPGGALTCFTVLFSQLGIPAEAVAAAAAVDSVLDFIGTAVSITCLQAELVLITDRLGMTDRDCLEHALGNTGRKQER